MSGLFGAYGVDSKKEVEGIEVELLEAPNEDKSIPTFTLSRMSRSNTQYTKAMETASRPFRKKQQLGQLSAAESDAILLEVFCGTVLKGWANVRDAKGQEIAFTVKAAMQLMTDLPDLYDRLLNEASEMNNFRTAVQEEEAKN